MDAKPGSSNRGMPADVIYRCCAAGVAGYSGLLLLWGNLRLHHAAFAVLFWACWTRREAPRRFVRDWWPLILFWMNYDLMRVYTTALFSRVRVEEPLRWEEALFLSPTGTIWPFYFTHWLGRHQGEFLAEAISRYCSVIYFSHIFLVPVLILIIWLRGRELLFRQLLWAFTALHIVAMCIYISYPAAPPWWVYQNGFEKPTPARSAPVGLGEGSVLSGMFQLSPNRFAAIPSVHAAYPILLTLVLALHAVRKRYLCLCGLYAASMWFACVFLNQHYIVDLLLGAALVPVGVAAGALVRPRADEATQPLQGTHA